jgi:hypothetical protein
VPVASFPLEGAERAQELPLVLNRLDSHHAIEDLGDACGAGAGNDLFGDAGEHRATVVIEKARVFLLLPARVLRRVHGSRGARGRHRSREPGSEALQNIAAPDPGGWLTGFRVHCHRRLLPGNDETLP